jgi:hypothetical protein
MEKGFSVLTDGKAAMSNGVALIQKA